jgi:hypothetical protein
MDLLSIGGSAPPKGDGFLNANKAHCVSLDWLLCGDLKGLQRMVHERKLRPARVSKVDRIMEKYHRLPPEQQKTITGVADQLLEQRP